MFFSFEADFLTGNKILLPNFRDSLKERGTVQMLTVGREAAIEVQVSTCVYERYCFFHRLEEQFVCSFGGFISQKYLLIYKLLFVCAVSCWNIRFMHGKRFRLLGYLVSGPAGVYNSDPCMLYLLFLSPPPFSLTHVHSETEILRPVPNTN